MEKNIVRKLIGNLHMEKFDLTDCVIFDTETTGVDIHDEVIELGIIDAVTGEVLFHSYLKPICAIHPQALEVHKITPAMLEDAPTWNEVQPELIKILEHKKMIAYNIDFDARLLAQTALVHKASDDLYEFWVGRSGWMVYAPCAMLWYAQYFGVWNNYRNDWKWQKLVNAAEQQNIDISDLTAHRAVSDCEITRRVIHAVNAKI